MSLNIYELEDHLYLHKKPNPFHTMEYVEDIELEWGMTSLQVDSVVQDIVRAIDEAEMYQENGLWKFHGKFGDAFFSQHVSTTAKALILLYEHPDKLYNFHEVGSNGLKFAIEHFTEGHFVLWRVNTKISPTASINVIMNEERGPYYIGSDFNEWC